MEHFTKVKPINYDNPKSQCKYCTKFYSYHYKNDSSSMLHYLQNACEASSLRDKGIQKSQTSRTMRDVRGRVYSPIVKYDTEKLRVSTARFLIKCELPFKLMEHEEFIMWLIWSLDLH